jgi:hypothetical protein
MNIAAKFEEMNDTLPLTRGILELWIRIRTSLPFKRADRTSIDLQRYLTSRDGRLCSALR